VSEPYGLLIVGGGPAGLSAARAYRQAGGGSPVAIVTDEGRMPYNRPPLTKQLLSGEMEEAELPLEEETWLAEHAVGLIDGRAVAVDPTAREVVLSGGRRLRYAQLLLATGAEPVRLPVAGADDPAVRVLRTLDHLRELQIRLIGGAQVIVIGSGFIGCEIAASLCRGGHPVTLVSDEAAPNARRLGADVAAELAGWLREDGVSLRLGCPVQAITRHGRTLSLQAQDERLEASVIVMSTGVAPRSELIGPHLPDLPNGAIPVDAAMRTSLPNVLAAGDVCLAVNAAAGRPLRVEHWGDALSQGAVAGRTAAGQPAAWAEVPGFWSTIGGRTLKYAAWGDGFDDVAIRRAGQGGFVASYGREGRLVGLLAHGDDAAYEQARHQIAAGAPWR
jgi:3-phenylpropionate/trans-cinnamate dioxygenase ferredoxin reductase subunit